MLHLNFFKSLALSSILLILACSQPTSDPSDSFALLPSVAQNNFKSQNSKLDSNILKYAFSPSGEELPLRYGITQNFQKTDQAEKAHLEFSIQTREGKAPESYRLEIKEDKIIIVAQDHAGLFYAFITLNQLLEDAKDLSIPLPKLELEDTPKIAFRPIQIDVKHHLEKKSYYYDLIDELAQLKINGMIVEIEDKLQYKRRPEVASADALSIEEWSAISDYALARNIKISPLVQGLGHASFVLKHEKNKFLRDDPKSDWAFNPLDPETYALQYDLYLDALEAFPHGKYLHVGGDEVHTTGRGSGKSALELNLIWLNKVTSFAAKHNRIPIFWDDMPLKQAGLMRPIYDANMPVKTVDSIWQANEPILNRFIEQFPKNCVYMRWNYHRAESYGNGKAMDWFSSNGFQVMGATAGQTRWTLMPQREGNIDQIRIFAEQSINRNYDGLLLTLWDDDSPHFELYKRGIHAFAEFTWGGIKRSKEEFKMVYQHRKFGPKFKTEEYAFIDALDRPVGLWTNLLVEEGVHRNSLNQHKNPIEEQIIDLPEFNNKGAWAKKYAQRLTEIKAQKIRVSQVQNTLNQMQKEGTKAAYNLEVYQQLGKLVNYNFELMQALTAFDLAQSNDEETRVLEELKSLTLDFKNLRNELENVYSKTRILNKPKDYIGDQDHHRHPANQTVNFDWQFTSELMLLEKIRTHFQSQADWNEGKATRIQ